MQPLTVVAGSLLETMASEQTQPHCQQEDSVALPSLTAPGDVERWISREVTRG